MNNLLRLRSIFSLLILIICLVCLGAPQLVLAGNIIVQPTTIEMIATKLPQGTSEKLCPEFGTPIDLNNANIIAFKDCRGFYPNLAKLIIQHSPYQKVEDVLEIPGLSERQKKLLNSHLVNFEVTPPIIPLEMRMPPRPAMR